MRGRDQIAGGEGAFACACCDNVPSGEDSTPSRQWSDTHSRSECVSTCAGHTFGYESVSEEAWADAGTEAPDGIPYEMRPPARKRRRNSDFGRNRCENACSGVEMTPERRSRTHLLRERALRRESDAATGVPDGIPHEVRPPARKRRRNSDFARNCCENAPSGAKRRRRATSCVLVATSQTDTRRACRTSRRRRPRWCPRRSPAGQGSRRHRR